MYITPIFQNHYNQNSLIKKQSGRNDASVSSNDKSLMTIPLNMVSFHAVKAFSVKQIQSKKNELANNIISLLKLQPKNLTKEEIETDYLKHFEQFQLHREKSLLKLQAEIEQVKNSRFLSNQQQFEELTKIQKKLAKLKQEKFKYMPDFDKGDETLSYALLNKFKVEQERDNYGFNEIFKNHYR